jgi:hypothetical protein
MDIAKIAADKFTIVMDIAIIATDKSKLCGDQWCERWFRGSADKFTIVIDIATIAAEKFTIVVDIAIIKSGLSGESMVWEVVRLKSSQL